MATYLQGAQDYIPQLQPFQPDLNLYSNVLQTKQTQYDTAYKSLNKIYGQYFYSDLTRDTNIQRKDEILKNIDFNLTRVAGLDLSLDQNVSQAVQVFKPFYDDKFIMKDMAWTKNYIAQRQRADGLKNSTDEKIRAQYWDTGVKALDYTREEFKNTSDDDSLGFNNVSYTNYVNVQKEAMKLAKEAGLSIETVKFSDDPGKSWIIKTKNGQQLMEPLSKLFESTLGSDPAIQAVYQTQAYVNRKDYAYSNAGQFSGDQTAAEMKYLEESYNLLKQDNVRRYNQLKNDSQVYDAQIASVEKAIKNGTAQPGSDAFLAQLREAKGINDSVLSRVEAQNEQLSDKDGTATTSTGFQNPYGDIQSLRYKVDNGMAAKLMQKDLNESAEIFAFQNAKQDIEANPYAVNEQKFKHEMALADRRGQYMLKATELRNRGERKTMMDKWALESGSGYRDPQTGEVKFFESMDYTYVDASNKGKGDVTGEKNMKVVSESMMKQRTNEYVVPWAKDVYQGLMQLKEAGLISDDKINWILNGTSNRNVTLEQFKNKASSTPNTFFRKELGGASLNNINNRFNMYLKANSKQNEVQEIAQMTYNSREKLGDYTRILQDDQDWRINTSKSIENTLLSQGEKGASYLYDPKGNLRSRDEYVKALISSGKIGKEYVEAYEGYKAEQKQIAAYNKGRQAIIEGVSQIPGLGWLPYATKTAEAVTSLYPQEKYSKYDPKVNPLVKKMLDGFDYDKLVGKAAKAYSDRNVIANAPPGIGKYGDTGKYDPGTGLYTPGRTAIDVSTKAFGTKGNTYFQQFGLDHRGLDYNDPTKVAVSFDGATKTAFDAAKDSDINSVGRALMDELIANSRDIKSKYIHFSLQAQRIAAGDANKAAMVIKPDYAWLSQYVGKRDKDGEKTNLLTPEDANKILQNGIVIMADASAFQNGLMKGSTMSPLDASIDYNPKGVTIEGPSGYSSMRIKKNEFGTGNYATELTYSLYDPNTNEMRSYSDPNRFVQSNSADDLREELKKFDEMILNYNIQANGGR
jgi:hypothetical protein